MVVASYTKAAATELNRRQLPIPRENIGTLHALCYRSLKQYEIAEVKAKEFNELHPQDAISVAGNSQMDEMAADAVFATDGDKHLNNYNLWRAKCLDLGTLPPRTIAWLKKWENWKLNNHYIDFTDMISITLSMREPMAGEPIIGIYDECQDFNKLEMRLVRHWSKYQDHIIMAGDDDQTLYDFCGASPDAFLYPEVSADHKRVLNQSWRLPRAIYEFSQRWIKKIQNREPKEFNPKAEEGSVTYINATYKTPQAAIELAERYTRDGKTVMLLTTCGYLLNTIKTELRSAGLPFHNPFRSTRGDWNPMGSFHSHRSGRVSTRERILAFLDSSIGVSGNGYWNADKLSKWIELIRIKGILKHGAKERITTILEDRDGWIDDEAAFYADIFEPYALEKAMQRDLEWFDQSLLAAKRSVAAYPLTVYKKQGIKALEEKPKIITGTVHSVKGGECDVTILFPDMSQAAMEDYHRNPDATIRTFYVGMTRARESLVICKPYSNMSVKLN